MHLPPHHVATLNSNGCVVRDHRGLVRAGARSWLDGARGHGAPRWGRRRVRAGNGLDAAHELPGRASSEDRSNVRRYGAVTQRALGDTAP